MREEPSWDGLTGLLRFPANAFVVGAARCCQLVAVQAHCVKEFMVSDWAWQFKGNGDDVVAWTEIVSGFLRFDDSSNDDSGPVNLHLGRKYFASDAASAAITGYSYPDCG